MPDRKKPADKKSLPPEQNKFITDKEVRNLGLIILGGLVLRLIFYFELKGTPLFTDLYSDSKIFSDLAQDMAKDNNWFGSMVFYMSPGYTYFLAVIYSLFGNDAGLIRIIQILINLANILIIYLLAKDLFSSKTAYAAAIISVL